MNMVNMQYYMLLCHFRYPARWVDLFDKLTESSCLATSYRTNYDLDEYDV